MKRQTEGQTAEPRDAASPPDRIEPIAFRPSSQKPRRRRPIVRPVALSVGAVFLLLAAITWYLFSARSVELQFDPRPDRLELSGGLPTFELGGRYLALPGDYRVVAEKAGYHPFETTLWVGEPQNQTYRFELRKLPGRISIRVAPAEARVSIDGEVRDTASSEALVLEPGEHRLQVSAERYVSHEQSFEVEGGGVEQTLDIALEPETAPVTLATTPPGATVYVDDQSIGTTPLTAQLAVGTRRVEIALGGYRTWRDELSVVAGQPLILQNIVLRAAEGSVEVRSVPSGAIVTVDGSFRGRTPLELALAPGSRYRIDLTKPGYAAASRTVEIESRQPRTIELQLQPLIGEIAVRAQPADAEVYIDGERRGQAGESYRLTAVAHQIEIRKEGYVAYRTSVTPRPGFPQEVSATLKTLAQAREEAIPQLIRTGLGQELRLIEPGQFTMGASRREQGARANETPHEVELTKRFYIGVKEVTNRQFRAFDPSHSSGMVQRYDVNGDDQPAVLVTWEQAARYCNWLSERESLPPAYLVDGDKVVARSPLSKGYRLPTEAEWEWVARHVGRSAPVKYPWGNEMPPEDRSGNFADRSATRLVSDTMGGYRDGFPATAPVGEFRVSPAGLYDIGGNVAEWVHDLYSVFTGNEGISHDPTGPTEGLFHTIRGSSWMHGTITELRLTYRDYGDIARPDLGFRIARYLED